MFRKYTEDDLTDEALGGSSDDEIIDYKTKEEIEEDDYIRSREKAKELLIDGEKVLWEGRPNSSLYGKKAYVELKMISIVWLCFDIPMFLLFMIAMGGTFFKIIILLFFAVHLTPVWIYISALVQRKDIENSLYYMLTDKKIIVSYYGSTSGIEWIYIPKIECTRFEEGQNIGTIRFLREDMVTNGKKKVHTAGIVDERAFIAIEEYDEVCKILYDLYPNRIK